MFKATEASINTEHKELDVELDDKRSFDLQESTISAHDESSIVSHKSE
jgi:hypothetical protein